MTFHKKDCIAMLLAGGQGSRLTVLTEETAKPAVPFGGKYRIIDFPLSNCVNSGIDTVGILTQYQPLQLNEYIGNGSPWGLNTLRGGIHVLSPYSKSKSAEWYRGTANAIYQNINFIDRYSPDDVLILSGDHIYQMDYRDMISFHRKSNADITVAVIEVPFEDASRFGIIECKDDGKIKTFEEKPKEPKSNTASMGIYVFKWGILKESLIKDNADVASNNDFGKNIIPTLLKNKARLFAYRFYGYWKDVGTIQSLWEANMDILGDEPKLNLREKCKVYARNSDCPSGYFSKSAKIENSLVAEGCSVYGKVRNSVISTGVTVEKGVEINDSFIMPNAYICKNCRINYAIIGEDSYIGNNSVIGNIPSEVQKKNWGIAVVGGKRVISQNYILLPKVCV